MQPNRSRPRLTIRRLMAVVAILALLMGEGVWISEMRARSAVYRLQAFDYELMTLRAGSNVLTEDGRFVRRYDDENDWLCDAWACQLAEKYRRLSDYPWLSVGPDLPPPERLAHPRRAIDLPPDVEWGCSCETSETPWWTFLWTWRRR